MQLNFLFSFFIRPIELVFEFIFSSVYKLTGNVGLSVMSIGIIMNILILPIYMRADKLTLQINEKKKKIQPFVSMINKSFKGDERFMMLQALYREKNYNPASTIISSISILLEIPFFIAGFHLLSGLKIVQGVPFLFINDLGQPDSLFMIGSFTVNILPIMMTVINVISSIIYSKDQSTSTKIQTYVLAAIFLVLLYDSPSCLVLYWTTNNLFSLIKNIVISVVKKYRPERKPALKKIDIFNFKRNKTDAILTFAALFFIAFLTGAQVSSDVIGSNVQAFLDPYHLIDPNIYVFNSLCISLGMYVLWGTVIYFLISEYARNIMNFIVIVISLICTINYFAFNSGGSITPQMFVYGAPKDPQRILLNSVCILMITALLFIFYKNNRKYATWFLVLEAAAVLVLSSFNIVRIEKQYRDASYIRDQQPVSELNLSRNGQNVIVIMLDKSAGFVLPYVMNEDPELVEQFDGFTFYPNTLSFGAYTMSGSPALYGGYEYTPDLINRRSDILLSDKQNEALLVMPVNFDNNGYNVTVCDPTLANYGWVPDHRIYNDYPDINTYMMMGAFNDYIGDEVRNLKLYERNFFCYGFFRLSPMLIRDVFYDGSMFNAADREYYFDYTQILEDASIGHGFCLEFLDSYTALTALPALTTVDDSSEDNFIMFSNNCIHDPCILSEPDYVPSLDVNNSVFDMQNMDRFNLGDESLTFDNSLHYTYYESMMASLQVLGDWFDYLRQCGVYDNTRIIIVADHGTEVFYETEFNGVNQGHFNPMLLVKDFGSEGFTVSDEFMTNAETPFLAFDGIISNPVNPSTGNPLVSQLNSDSFTVMYNDDIVAEDVEGRTTYSEGVWYEVDGDVLAPDSWTPIGRG